MAGFPEHDWQLAHDRSLTLGPKSQLMGVLNVTPDSFSDGGNFLAPELAQTQAISLHQQGASIIDVGAESTKPGANPVGPDEEVARLLPVLGKITDALPGTIISVDTYRASTARLALSAGAHIINDVWGLQREPEIARVVADHKAGLIIMHTNREREILPDVIEDQLGFFGKSLEIAEKAGISPQNIVLDPGFGFGKETAAMNLQLMARFEELQVLGFPILVGTSRKRFLGTVTERDPADRDVATAASNVLLRQKGAAIFRVHDVQTNADALKVCDAVLGVGQ